MKRVEIFTDGSCYPNPGPGAYCAILRYGQREKVLCEGFELTTNNRMEIYAIIMALEALKRPCDVTIYSDSLVAINGCNGTWKRRTNCDLYDLYDRVSFPHRVRFVHVKGHSGHKENERCDRIAGARRLQVIERMEQRHSHNSEETHEHSD